MRTENDPKLDNALLSLSLSCQNSGISANGLKLQKLKLVLSDPSTESPVSLSSDETVVLNNQQPKGGEKLMSDSIIVFKFFISR